MTSTYDSRRWHKHFDAVIQARGGVRCSRCPGLIRPGEKYHIDHVVELVRGGPANDVRNLWPCHPACNMRAGQALGQARRRARGEQQSRIREW